MTMCERCGNAVPDTAAICPSCGTALYRPAQAMPGSYDQPSVYPPPVSGYPPPSAPGYPPQSAPGYPPQSAPGYPPQQMPGYATPMYQQPAPVVNINVGGVTGVVAPTVNNTPVIVEVLLNIFTGIYGVGWLMAGETVPGIVLLICSILLYWPIMIVAFIFTLGFGLICTGPLAIGAIILNAILLHNSLKSKAAVVVMQPVQMMPPM